MPRRNGNDGIDTSAATVQPYGENTNRLMSISDLAKTLEGRNKARLDVIARRKDIDAVEMSENGERRFGIRIKGQSGFFRPTNVSLSQMAQLTRIPLDHLRLAAAKYPDLAADMFNRWWNDEDIANRVGTSRVRVKKIIPGDQRQMMRNFATNGDTGVVRAVLSPGYRIIDNHDVASVVLGEMDKAKRDDIKMSGALSERRMDLNFTLQDMRAEINFPNKGKGHDLSIRVPCGAGLRVRNSDVGLASLVVVPTLMVFTCTNLLVSTEELAQVHIGSDYREMDVLEPDTIRKMNSALFARMQDVIRACLVAEKFQKIANLFSENAGWPISHPEKAIENITEKFALTEEMGKGILSKYIEGSSEHGANRFSMAQAITAQAHEYEDSDYEKAVVLQETGSTILRMAQKDFAKHVDVEVKSSS
jgi:hypothetical protein